MNQVHDLVASLQSALEALQPSLQGGYVKNLQGGRTVSDKGSNACIIAPTIPCQFGDLTKTPDEGYVTKLYRYSQPKDSDAAANLVSECNPVLLHRLRDLNAKFAAGEFNTSAGSGAGAGSSPGRASSIVQFFYAPFILPEQPSVGSDEIKRPELKSCNAIPIDLLPKETQQDIATCAQVRTQIETTADLSFFKERRIFERPASLNLRYEGHAAYIRRMLDILHQNGVAHGDLHPNNLGFLQKRENEDGTASYSRVCLFDWERSVLKDQDEDLFEERRQMDNSMFVKFFSEQAVPDVPAREAPKKRSRIVFESSPERQEELSRGLFGDDDASVPSRAAFGVSLGAAVAEVGASRLMFGDDDDAGAPRDDNEEAPSRVLFGDTTGDDSVPPSLALSDLEAPVAPSPPRVSRWTLDSALDGVRAALFPNSD